MVNFDVRALVPHNIETAELLLHDAHAYTSRGVVFRMEHVDPALVVVQAEGNCEIFGVGLKWKFKC